MTSPAVSVVIPVRDGERYLGEAIRSVLAQTTPPGELIVVDDGSQDASAEIAASFAPVQLITGPPRGAPAARNAGVRRARGDLVAFLDADDVWAPDKLTLQLAALSAPETPDLVFGHVDEFLSPELTAEELAALPAPRGVVAGRVVITLLVRRAALERAGAFAEDLPAADFLDWLARSRALGQTETMLEAVVARRRIHRHNTQWASRPADVTRALRMALARRVGDGG